MRKFIVKRLVISVLIFFCVAFIIYALMRSLPTSFIQTVARERSAGDPSKSYDQWMKELTVIYNMDKGVFAGFSNWIWEMLQGKFGDSWYYGMPVVEKFKSCIMYSLWLNIITFTLQIVIAVPLGITTAVHQYSYRDYIFTFLAMVGMSLPTFFFATILKYVFAGRLHWFEAYGMISRNNPMMTPFEQFLDLAWHFVLPVVTLTILSIGGLMRYVRTNMLEVLNSDYIRTARAKGLSESKVINRHAFRNTLIPIVTMVGGSIPGLFSGAMITEQLFAIEGIGYYSYQAMTKGDIPFYMFYMCFLAILTLLGNLISDVLYAVVDPRVRLG